MCEGAHSCSTVPNSLPPSAAVSAKLQSRGLSGEAASISAGSANAPSRGGGAASSKGSAAAKPDSGISWDDVFSG